MNVLIISSENNTRSASEAVLCDALTAAFRQNDISYTFNPKEAAIDCIVLLNKKLQAKARKVKRIFRIPLIYIFYKSSISENYAIDVMNIDYTFIVNDIDLNVSYPYLDKLQEVGLMFSVEHDDVPYKYDMLDIYVSIDDRMCKDNTLLKMIRPLNKLTELKIEINSSNVELMGILGSNIEIQDSNNAIEQRVANSKLVVGSGYAILYAIKHKKPFLVIGEKGYAGILKNEDMELHYNNFFQGALDGKFDDAIPEEDLLEDIYSTLSSVNKPLLADDKIIAKTKIATDSIMEIVTEIVRYNKQISTDFENVKVIFNPDFIIEDVGDSNSLLNRHTREIITCISNGHYSLIKKCIDHPVKINEFAKVPSIRKRLKELRRNNVIVSVLGNHPAQDNEE